MVGLPPTPVFNVGETARIIYPQARARHRLRTRNPEAPDSAETAMIRDMEFCCPGCGRPLAVTSSHWSCTPCNMNWSIDQDGVALLSEKDYFFGTNRESMRRLLGELREMSPDQLEAETARLEDEYEDFSARYCSDPSRADWTFLGDFSDKIVLDVGCGFGSVSIPLAERARTVISVDATLERVRFLSILKRIRRISNIVPIHGDVTRLPLGPASVDRIVMVGLLEYAGHFSLGGSPRHQQREFLQYLCRRLRPGGELWIGIENRLSPRHFFGRTYHQDLPFTPLLPQAVANAITRMIRGEPYRLSLSSESGYRKMIAASGFEDTKFFYAFNDYRYPRFIASDKNCGVIREYIRSVRVGGSSRTRVGLAVITLLDRLRLAGTFAPCFFIRATKV